MAVPAPSLLEREIELAVIEDAFDGLTTGGGTVVIEGPPGIGKTALIGEAVAIAAGRGLRVMRAAGSELERDYAFGVVRQLLGPDLGGERALALVDRGFAMLNDLFWQLVTELDGAPALIAVDDLHWADEPSVDFLRFVSHRAVGLPLLCLFGRRPSRRGHVPGAEVVRPAPLSVDAAGVVLATGSPAFVAACHEATRGNPLLLDTVRRWVAARQLEPTAAAVAQLSDGAAPLAQAVVDRMRPRGERGLLAEAVAILGDACRLVDAAHLAGLYPDAATGILDQLALDGVLTVDPLAFVQPLLLSATRDAISPARRAVLHERAARIVADAGGPPAAVATHLLRALPSGDPWAVDWLRRAAAAAADAGAMASAITLLRRARAEPPPPEARDLVALELGIAEARANDSEAFRTLGAAAAAEAPWIRTAATLAQARLHVFRGGGDDAVAALSPLVGTLDDERDLGLLVEAELIDAAWSPHTLPLRQAALDRFEALVRPDDHVYPVLPVSRAFDLAIAGGDAAAVEALVMPGVAGHRVLRAIGPEGPIVYLAINTLGLIERPDLALPLADAALAAARARGSQFATGYLLTYRSIAELRYGSVARAVAEARAGLDVIAEQSYALGAVLATTMLAEALIEHGDLAGAQAAVAAGPPPKQVTDNPFAPVALGAIGHLQLVSGRAQDAVATLRACGEAMAARGWNTPGLVPWRSLAARALRATGREAEARDIAGEELAVARTAGRPRAIAVALLALGGRDAIDEAVALLAPTQARLAHAHALTALGHDQLGRGDRATARATFTLALDQAHAAQGQAAQAQARSGLRAAGGRPRRARVNGPEGLTASERRVADLAADGATNREIAESLFVTAKTVETHLSSIFRKLAIGSRTELAPALRRTP